ncbi:glycerophosphodiester phosphodiesterase [Engelhardtia mirabilis]|uniref:Glycerophosphoryl diester phosphodiesterase n=1 Tax=Engelhardtia mirabilis TaxID=2528011 RepID=A0A518BIG3_9BACT|nr:Glycerophosphoryl diester phosphodiesterase [Planctomycetes bacterium Pla133]QDV01094.1 Glycerophosphoryl diester phosphodiesterase [Planctomycetes bacterium Pla86]
MREASELESDAPLFIPGPPWILGHRGSPREAPENTTVSLRRALIHGLDGFEYDVHGTIDGEPVLIHDDTVTRTTDGRGAVGDKPLTELLQLDAGGWFHKRFAGEPLPLLEEVLPLERPGDSALDPPIHMIELKESGLVDRVAQLVEAFARDRSIRIASFHRSVVLAARDAGLPTMLLAHRPDEDDLGFVRRERIDAHGLEAGGWAWPGGDRTWPCERWEWSVDDPGDLLAACRRPLFGFNTNEARRALAVRALCHLTPDDEGGYPLAVPELEILPGDPFAPAGEWAGRWTLVASIRNPFPHAVDVELGFAGRNGAFEVAAEPSAMTLAAGEARPIELRLVGGSFSPGADPLLFARFAWKAGPGRSAGALLLDAPLTRLRRVVLRDHSTRLDCLRESPRARAASLSMRRSGRWLMLAIEDAGGLAEAQVVAHLDGRTHFGARSLRLPLPDDFDHRRGGVSFSAGLVGHGEGSTDPLYRRWAGGLPADLLSGSPGRLLPAV